MIKINLIEPIYIGVDFPIRVPGFVNESKWGIHADVIDSHVYVFRTRTGAKAGWIWHPQGAHDIYVTVEPAFAAKYVKEASEQFPSFRFVPGIDPRQHLAWYPETASKAGNDYSEMDVGAA
ncbi:MAG: hypothetical protein HY517_03135 [Candidatus Aenigmarchaeota archaeon]|nr:hypothetical protein [Candidatus Aenigmarchaeota archaeon]